MRVYDGSYACILEAMLYGLFDVRYEVMNRAAIHYRTRDSLGYLDRLRLAKVPNIRTEVHSFCTSHTAVFLHTLSFVEKVVTGGFFGTTEEGSTHYCAGSETERFDHVTTIGYTTIGDYRDIELLGEAGHVVHSGSLGSSNCTHLLRRADATTTHANS